MLAGRHTQVRHGVHKSHAGVCGLLVAQDHNAHVGLRRCMPLRMPKHSAPTQVRRDGGGQARTRLALCSKYWKAAVRLRSTPSPCQCLRQVTRGAGGERARG